MHLNAVGAQTRRCRSSKRKSIGIANIRTINGTPLLFCAKYKEEKEEEKNHIHDLPVGFYPIHIENEYHSIGTATVP